MAFSPELLPGSHLTLHLLSHLHAQPAHLPIFSASSPASPTSIFTCKLTCVFTNMLTYTAFSLAPSPASFPMSSPASELSSPPLPSHLHAHLRPYLPSSPVLIFIPFALIRSSLSLHFLSHASHLHRLDSPHPPGQHFVDGPEETGKIV